MREKLIELLMQAKIGWTKAELADYLLLHGVTVPVRVEDYSLNPNLEKNEIDFDYNAEDV